MASKPGIRLTLPPDQRKFLDRQVDAGGFGTPSEFIRHLLRKAQVESTIEAIDEKLIASRASGPARRMTRKDWTDMTRRVEKRVAVLRAEGDKRRRRSA